MENENIIKRIDYILMIFNMIILKTGKKEIKIEGKELQFTEINNVLRSCQKMVNIVNENSDEFKEQFKMLELSIDVLDKEMEPVIL